MKTKPTITKAQKRLAIQLLRDQAAEEEARMDVECTFIEEGREFVASLKAAIKVLRAAEAEVGK